MAGFGGFRPAAFRFLRDLERNNAKAWFEANRDVYELDPMRLLVETLDAGASLHPEITQEVAPNESPKSAKATYVGKR
jgi:uncharacterized protein (DUF2461 family)